eukprot:5814389-Prymnesium_polylepis.1
MQAARVRNNQRGLVRGHRLGKYAWRGRRQRVATKLVGQAAARGRPSRHKALESNRVGEPVGPIGKGQPRAELRGVQSEWRHGLERWPGGIDGASRAAARAIEQPSQLAL